jgi:hypothetical protein
MFAHLTQNGTDIQMDISWVQNLEAIIDTLSAEMQIVVFNFKGLLKIAKCRSKFLGTSENASEVIVSYCSVFVTFFG